MNSIVNNPEMQKVIDFLTEQKIPFELLPLYGGYLLAVPSEAHREFDLVSHPYSFGGDRGLLESMGCISESSIGDNVEGWLTGETAIERIKKHVLNNPIYSFLFEEAGT